MIVGTLFTLFVVPVFYSLDREGPQNASWPTEEAALPIAPAVADGSAA